VSCVKVTVPSLEARLKECVRLSVAERNGFVLQVTTLEELNRSVSAELAKTKRGAFFDKVVWLATGVGVGVVLGVYLVGHDK